MQTTDIQKLIINQLTEEQYQAAKTAGTLNQNELYFTDDEDSGEYIPTTEKGAAGGVASLDSSGKIPTSQLPIYDGSVT